MSDTNADAAAQTPGDSTENQDATADAAMTDGATTTEDGSAALGDAGKKALEAMKAERKAARDEAAAAKAELAALKAKSEGREAEFAAQQEAQRIKDEALSVANERILKAEVRAAAAQKLADPADALRFLDLSEFEVGTDGEVDSKAVGRAIDNLIASKPYLAAQGKRFQGTADGGARNDATAPAQLAQSDLDRMSPAEIDKAHREGRFDQLLGSR